MIRTAIDDDDNGEMLTRAFLYYILDYINAVDSRNKLIDQTNLFLKIMTKKITEEQIQ